MSLRLELIKYPFLFSRIIEKVQQYAINFFFFLVDLQKKKKTFLWITICTVTGKIVIVVFQRILAILLRRRGMSNIGRAEIEEFDNLSHKHC